jgi:hypothetical protein
MKSRLLTILVLFATVSTFAQDHQGQSKADGEKLVQMEKDSWNAWKSRNSEWFQQNLADDAVAVDERGAVDKQTQIHDIDHPLCAVDSYSMENASVRWLDPNTALLTYKADKNVTCSGQKGPTSVSVASLWMQRGGRWERVFHQETLTAEALRNVSRR